MMNRMPLAILVTRHGLAVLRLATDSSQSQLTDTKIVANNLVHWWTAAPCTCTPCLRRCLAPHRATRHSLPTAFNFGTAACRGIDSDARWSMAGHPPRCRVVNEHSRARTRRAAVPPAEAGNSDE